MKDLKYLFLLICFVIVAHAAKKYEMDRTEAKDIQDLPSEKKQKKTDSLKTEISERVKIIPAVYN